MDTQSILATIDAEIEKLQKAKAVLSQVVKAGTVTKTAIKATKRPRLSKAARAKIAAAQRKRWAAAKKKTE
jgi:hypothetical protein